MGSSVLLPPPGQPGKGPDPAFKSASTPNVVTFGFEKIGPPSPLYVQLDDQLVVTIAHSILNAQFQVSYRFLLPGGPVPGQPDQAVESNAAGVQQFRGWIDVAVQIISAAEAPNDRVQRSFKFDLPECYLLSVSIDGASGTTILVGQAFVNAGITRRGPGLTRYAQLFAGNVASGADLGWPGGPQRSAMEGPGWIHSLQVANPGAGADWTFTVPALARMRLDSFNAVFTAAVAVANRQVQLTVDDGSNTMWTDDLSANITAGQTINVAVTQTNVPTGVVTTTLHMVIPPGLILAPGWRLRAVTGAIQAADQWSAIWLNLEEWISM